MIAILTDLQTQLDGHAKVNQDKCLEIETLKNELSQCKQEIYRLDTQKVKLDLENKVRQEQALVIQRNKRNAELVQENDLLKSTLSGKEKSIAFLQSEKEKILSEKKDLAIKPKKATNDLHKDILGTRNPGLGYMAKRAQPALYDADTLLHPTHHPVSIWDSEEVLVHPVVKHEKMNENHGACFRDHANGFYEKLNALMFVPQQELSREQAYWLPANERASQTSNPNRPVTPFVHKSRPPSQVLASLQKVNAVFPQFEGSTTVGCDQQALDTDRIQLKDTITSLRIQLDSLKVENVSLKRRYDELSKANTPLTLQRDRLVSDSGAPRHMTGDRARLINFVEKFIGTVRFGNDEYAAIVGYGDYNPVFSLELSTTFKTKEPTFQVALDVLSLTPFYPAFFITASIPAVYMHEFWATASYHKHSIIFKLNTKSYSFDLDTFRNMLQMCPKLPGQKFVDPPFEEKILTFMRELSYSGNIKLLSDVKVEILP
ncbi:hypothetical protein Tco_1227086 [Tanacetum coccineum]